MYKVIGPKYMVSVKVYSYSVAIAILQRTCMYLCRILSSTMDLECLLSEGSSYMCN